ncbi:MAG: bifunctional phosphopantothenoylcysteine decarboxylase/phosphopantothenate--cysteine ligase CoaBC [Proteobacteria bacterium]|nr:bifunctional phosphopantothenoylcysteine decarboxylase/phosphopantothenate--cysteine ligase CoaBC [Pseudomonadota bacterium]
MSRLAEKRILLGVTGGIAAYKACELTRQLIQAGACVRVVMTRAAQSFVAPLSFQALSGNPVHLDLLDTVEESAMGHIRLARWADLILIAPATADFMARLRAGLANELLGAVCLAAEVPILVAPSMNRAMWSNPATQDNASCLAARGIRLLGPAEGGQACGESGYGRMLEPAEICRAMGKFFVQGSLAGRTVLVSAGPTREAIDPVRYLTNRSSGKMGYAMAQAAIDAGAKVTLVSGPVALDPPMEAQVVRVESAAEMFEAVVGLATRHDIYIGTAAVADYTPAMVAAEKIKKHEAALVIRLTRTRDILTAVASLPNKPFTVGFAAETGNLESYAKEKLEGKGLDMIAANRVGQAQGGFDSHENALWVCWNGGVKNLPMASKQDIAIQLIELISENYRAKNST